MHSIAVPRGTSSRGTVKDGGIGAPCPTLVPDVRGVLYEGALGTKCHCDGEAHAINLLPLGRLDAAML